MSSEEAPAVLAVGCTVCHRAVYSTDVDDSGKCILCSDALASAPDEVPEVGAPRPARAGSRNRAAVDAAREGTE